ncbi:hypothetical protein K493DRAFT_317771 [Basidiobolus meristosporus CBS 931.73]|uniref:Uncharacterized protein n=1 Tax=Basidiobolus meristosporus CBS 931.73 TaxID=1314790 RepID=A0A1Y1XY95_9FUNG|nr:hypothetical protein K493DRAFT_317771 [Basidiobolus meristosporus CBS 931.73]|eukprot:ORX90709.1 hypothetical protein K493DRAFT_317771 [Basidiobolus meristosporus CBS 931.73]
MVFNPYECQHSSAKRWTGYLVAHIGTVAGGATATYSSPGMIAIIITIVADMATTANIAIFENFNRLVIRIGVQQIHSLISILTGLGIGRWYRISP